MWTKTSRSPSNYLAPFLEQNLLEPLTVTGASASCFGERFRDLLYLPELRSKQEEYSTHRHSVCCTVCTHFYYSAETYVRAAYIVMCGTPVHTVISSEFVRRDVYFCGKRSPRG